jgi:hypothetical protein
MEQRQQMIIELAREIWTAQRTAVRVMLWLLQDFGACKRGSGSAPAESRGDMGKNGLHDMHIVSNTQLVRHSQ